MKFQEFENKIVKITKLKLPGEVAQFKMAPMERLAALKKIDIEKETVRKAGVLVLFYPSEAKQTMLALILRKTYKGVHSAQVAFPGGKYEETDSDFAFTALRETQEEVGVSTELVELIKPFTPMYIPPSNFMVHPFLGIVKEEIEFIETLVRPLK